jgi:hypothetical protein
VEGQGKEKAEGSGRGGACCERMCVSVLINDSEPVRLAGQLPTGCGALFPRTSSAGESKTKLVSVHATVAVFCCSLFRVFPSFFDMFMAGCFPFSPLWTPTAFSLGPASGLPPHQASPSLLAWPCAWPGHFFIPRGGGRCGQKTWFSNPSPLFMGPAGRVRG